MKVGYVHEKTHRCKVKVLLNGKDVTNRAFAADDVDNYVDMYRVNDDGSIYVDRNIDSVIRERVYGDVVIEVMDRV